MTYDTERGVKKLMAETCESFLGIYPRFR
jgi:hypothetical protein